MKTKSIIKGSLSFADRLYYRFNKKHFIPWQPFDFQNYLIQMDELRDGNILFKFKRFGHGKLDWADDLNFLLNEKVINHLIRKQGYLIAYIHLGDQKVKTNPLPLPELTIQKLRQIGELYHSGKVWIETTSRLLTYNWIYHHLKWAVKETETKYHIQIEGLKTDFPVHDLSIEDLWGFSFKAPANKEVSIFLKDRSIPCTVHLDKKKDEQFVMIPLSKIEWPL